MSVGPKVALPDLSLYPLTSVKIETHPTEGWTKVMVEGDPVAVDRLLLSLQVCNLTLDYQATVWPEPTLRVHRGRVYFRESTDDANVRALKAIYLRTRDEDFPMHLAADIHQIITEVAGLNAEEW